MTAAPAISPTGSRVGGFPVVGMVGGGQLARMTAPAAAALGVGLRVLSDSAHASAARVVADLVVGDERGLADVRRFAAGCDVVTFDHEHVPGEILQALEADGHVLRPGAGALAYAQDKLAMRRRLSAAGLPCPAWRAPASAADLPDSGTALGWPLVLKTSRGGYDGRGVWTVTAADDPAGGQPFRAGVPVLAEERVDFARELSAVVARSPHGQAVAYPVVESVQRDGICVEVVAPAPGLSDALAESAQRLALQVAAELDVVGLLAVELFETTGGGLLVNELAMRPHNSGHWSIDGAVTSQFENHLRAVLDLPLGSPRSRATWTVMANVLGIDLAETYPAYRHVLARDPALKLQWYGKAVHPGRKLGHVTAYGADLDDVRARVRNAAAYLAGAIDE